MKRKTVSVGNKLIAIVLIMLVGFFAFYYIYVNKFENKFYNETYINKVDVGGKTVKQAEMLIKNALGKQVTIKDGSTELMKINASDYNVKYDLKRRLKEIKAEEDALSFHEKLFNVKNYTEIETLNYDEDQLEADIKKQEWLSVGDDDKTSNAKLVYNAENDDYDEVEEHYGHNYTVKSVKKDILTLLSTGQETMDISTGEFYAKPTLLAGSPEIGKRKIAYLDTLRSTITYESKGKKTVVLDKNDYANWFTYKDGEVSISKMKAKEWVSANLKGFATYGDTISFKTTKKGTIKTKGSFGVAVSPEKEADHIAKDILAKKDVTRKPEYTGDPNAGDTYVEVDVRSQTVYCYIDGNLELKTPCVTGKMNGHKTDPGAWMIYYRKSPAVLRGPDYESPVTYWMNFNHGEGLHDARWRGRFGGSIYVHRGSHGCVNLPKKSAYFMWTHYKIGTPVIVFYKS
ncbi:MAG: L,D-transpeptidase family protein [bacterium]